MVRRNPAGQYAELLVEEIPPSKRLVVCREIFARRSESKINKLQYFFSSMLPALTSEDRADFAGMVSDELRDGSGSISFVAGALPSSFWLELSEIARLRSENKLIESVASGRLGKGDKLLAGALGTWTVNILEEMLLKHEFWSAIGHKLRSDDWAEKGYAFKWFASKADAHLPAPPPALRRAVKEGLGSGDVRFKDLVDSWAFSWNTGGAREPEDPWRKSFAQALDKFIPAQIEEVSELTDDDIPF